MEIKESLNDRVPVQEREEVPMAFTDCMRQVIGALKVEMKYSAMRLHSSALNSFMAFAGSGEEDGKVILFDEVFTPGMLKSYQEWLLRHNASWDTVSSYMRRLRSTYNRILLPGSAGYQPRLFDDVHTKVEAKTKRSLKMEQMDTLINVEIDSLPEELRPSMAYFLLMFFFRGMPFIDLAHLRKRDVRGRFIFYYRHKTGRQIELRIPREAEALLARYKDNNPSSPYLFPILSCKSENDLVLYLFYQKTLRAFNKRLAMLAKLLLPGTKLSSYTARHSWATLAFHMGVSVGAISAALGHSSTRVTETYLKPFENAKVDEMNDQLISIVRKRNLEMYKPLVTTLL